MGREITQVIDILEAFLVDQSKRKAGRVEDARKEEQFVNSQLLNEDDFNCREGNQ